MASWKAHKRLAFKYLKRANDAAASGHRLAAAMWRRRAAKEAARSSTLRRLG